MTSKNMWFLHVMVAITCFLIGMMEAPGRGSTRAGAHHGPLQSGPRSAHPTTTRQVVTFVQATSSMGDPRGRSTLMENGRYALLSHQNDNLKLCQHIGKMEGVPPSFGMIIGMISSDVHVYCSGYCEFA